MKKVLILCLSAVVLAGCWPSSSDTTSSTDSVPAAPGTTTIAACTPFALPEMQIDLAKESTVTYEGVTPFTFKYPAGWSPLEAPAVTQFNPGTNQSVDFRNTPAVPGQTFSQLVDVYKSALAMQKDAKVTNDCAESDGSRRVEVSYTAVDGTPMQLVSYYKDAGTSIIGISYSSPTTTFSALQPTVEAMRATIQ